MENIVEILRYILLSAAETWIGYKFFNSYMMRNSISQKWYNVGIVGYFIFQMLSYIYLCPLFSTALYYFGFSITIALVFFKDHIQHKLTVAWMFVIMNYACKTSIIALYIYFGKTKFSLVPGETVLDDSTQIMACALFTMCLWGTIRIRKLRLRKQFLLYSAISYTFPVSTLLLAIFLYRGTIQTTYNPLNAYVFISGLLFSATIALFYLLEKTVLLDINSERSAIMSEMLNLQREHYAKFEASQREVQSVRHDIKHHMRYIQSLLLSDKTREAIEYIYKIYEHNELLKGVTYSGNFVFDSILSHGFANIKSKDIKLSYSIVLPPQLSIDDLDLCILLGNLIENAVEACQRIPNNSCEKFIAIKACIKKDYLLLNISNSFDGVVNITNNSYRTTKLNKNYCGIGLMNIEKVVNKYNGELAIEHSDHVFQIFAMLMLPKK